MNHRAARLSVHSSSPLCICLGKGLPLGHPAKLAVCSCALILTALSSESQTDGGGEADFVQTTEETFAE